MMSLQYQPNQDSKKLGKFVGKWNGETERWLNQPAEQFTADTDGHQGSQPQTGAGSPTGWLSSPGVWLVMRLGIRTLP